MCSLYKDCEDMCQPEATGDWNDILYTNECLAGRSATRGYNDYHKLDIIFTVYLLMDPFIKPFFLQTLIYS